MSPFHLFQQKGTDYKNHHEGENSNFCSTDGIPSSPDFSNLNLDTYNELLEKLDLDQTPSPKTDMVGPPLAPILPFILMAPKFRCPPGKVHVCCAYIQDLAEKVPTECFYCESSQIFLSLSFFLSFFLSCSFLQGKVTKSVNSLGLQILLSVATGCGIFAVWGLLR